MKRKSKSKHRAQARAEHDAYLVRLGVKKNPKRASIQDFPSYEVENSTAHFERGLESVAGIAAKRSIDDYRWRKMEESSEAIQAAEAKKKRVGLPYSKGAYQYLTDGSDPSDHGKKK